MFKKVKTFFRKLDWYISKRILRKRTIKRKLDDFEMYLDLVTPGISRALAINKTRENDMIHIIKEILRPGMNVIDCGSNIGFYPLLEANILKGHGRIFAIEPDERNYEILKMNISLCDYGEIIEPYKLAVSNKSGTANMFVAQESNLNKLDSGDLEVFSERSNVDKIVEIKTTTIDVFCLDNKIDLDFLRMDIEGFEVEVLQGMHNTLNNSKSGFLIFLELHPYNYSDERNFGVEIEKLFDYGFYCKGIMSAGEKIPKKFRELGYNPQKEIESDGFIRGWYENIREKDVISLTCDLPKSSRYILFEKR